MSEFQSTLSLRRATQAFATSGWRGPDFNPRSPCGERPTSGGASRQTSLFQSTLSLRRATGWPYRTVRTRGISIHALLAESDSASTSRPVTPRTFQSTLSLRRATRTGSAPGRVCRYFNPRSPCGERQQIPPNWPYRFCLKCQFKDGEKSKKAKGSASAQASSPAYEKNKVRIPWGDFECFRFAPIK